MNKNQITWEPQPTTHFTNQEVVQPKTNVEKVTHYMEFGSAMNQLFLINAMNESAQRIVENETEVLEKMKNSFISGPAWVKSAKDWLAQQKS